jgi:hypothetical protein
MNALMVAILDVLRRENGRTSISDLRAKLRDRGWVRLGRNLVEFEHLVEREGFKLERTYTRGTNCVRMTEVVSE